ncbi:MAG: ARMT1-like domain-containing protein [Pseudobutyrivibrio sp.]|nr:ARMT1-like domain-containing protein [Pseudobutyrivibrio sp.]
MRFTSSCADCMYKRQEQKTDNTQYLGEIKAILDNRSETITSPEISYAFNKVHEKYFGSFPSYADDKKRFNDLVLSMEDTLRKKIKDSKDPLATAMVMARIGNYIDFGALDDVNEEEFLSLFENVEMRQDELKTYDSFCKKCEKANSFLLLTDNCGEVVIDKLMLEQLSERFPNMNITVMVRGGDVLNDATVEDAQYIGMTEHFKVITNGSQIAGTVYSRLSEEAQNAVDSADVILSKGQGNYESFAGEGNHAFFLFLCKCDLFINRFNVPKFTGMFVEE